MTKNPRVVVDAFLPDTLAIGDIVLRPITAATTMILQKIKSPIIDEKVIARAKKNNGKFGEDLSSEDIARLVFILTHPAKESHALLNRGRDVFELEVIDYLDRIAFADVPALGLLINKHFEKSFSTIIGGEVGQRPPDAPSDSAGKKNDGGDKTSQEATPGMPSPAMIKASAGP